MRRPVLAVALTAIALALAGCGRPADTQASAPAPSSTVASGPATGELTIWAMGAEGENLPTLLKDFEADNPDVKITVTPIPWSSAHDKFTTAITAQKTPDLAMIGTTWMGEFAGLDALDPTPSSIDSSVFFPGAWKTTEVNGTSYGIPWYVETRLVYYRTDLAEKAGITTPPTDWDGLKAMAKAMQDKAGAKWGINLQPGGTGSWQSVMPFAWSNGAQLNDGDQWTFDTPEMTEAVQYYQSFFTDGISNREPAPNETVEPSFVDGSQPMFISGPWEMSAVEKVGGKGFADKYSVMPMPVRKTSSSFVGGSNFAVFKNSQNKDAAWKLVQWLAQPDVQVKWYQLSTDLPSVQSAWQDEALASDTKLATFGKQLETAVAPPSFPTWEQVAAKFDTELENVTKSGADVSAALQTVQSQAQSIGTGS
ncbi:sugar ABC transporter substrate-binding protein [Propionicimonas sp.]|uniref:sugar ABC transporter substrate-binding protein n=1 Tax=Propionicimonas sp. TaxID=1955623 RepID=UPI003D0A7B02